MDKDVLRHSRNCISAILMLAGFLWVGIGNLSLGSSGLFGGHSAQGEGGISSVQAGEVSPAGNDALLELEAWVIRNAFRQVSRSVVRLEWVGGRNLLWEEMPGGALATGTVLSPDGLIVTSTYYFLDRPSAILVRFSDGEVLPGRMRGRDFNRMITVIKVERELKDFVPRFCAEEDLEVGMRTVAVGWAVGEEPDLAVGILSAKRRIWGKAFQTDARTSPRNYGGPLVDLRGRLLGIIVPFSPDGKSPIAGVEWYDSGIGFAVPWWDIQAVLPRLAAGEDLYPAYLGVRFAAVNPILAEPVVKAVDPGSPAEELGLHSGDKIVGLGTKQIKCFSEVEEFVQQRYAGDEIFVQWLRDGNVHQGSVRLGGDRRVLQMGSVPAAP